MQRRVVSDAQWKRIKPLVRVVKASPKGGRPFADDRKCFEAVVWLLWTGAPWNEVPARFGGATTCWRRLPQWGESCIRMWREYLSALTPAEKIAWSERFEKDPADYYRKYPLTSEQSAWLNFMVMVVHAKYGRKK